MRQIAGRLERSLLHGLPAAVVVTDEQGRVVFWNRQAEVLFGYPAADALARPVLELNVGPADERAAEQIMAGVMADGAWEGEYDARRADGSPIAIQARLERINDPAIGFSGIVGTSLDISDRREAEAALIFERLHDPLTGLPNRHLFVEHLQTALARSERGRQHVAVLYVDLDDLGAVNALSGVAVGDEVLRAVGARLSQALRPGDIVARVGGDEFAICCVDLHTPDIAGTLADRALTAVRQPVRIDGVEHLLDASVGVAVAAGDDRPDALLRDTAAAMLVSKRRGGGGIEIVDSETTAAARERAAMAAELRAALSSGEVVAHFQPQMRIDGGGLAGFEALARWTPRSRGAVSPKVFVEIAEGSGLAAALGRTMLEQACTALARWHAAAGACDLTVSVNVSPHQLDDPAFAGEVRDLLTRVGIPPRCLVLEVTESALLDVGAAAAALRRLCRIGVQIGIDDFGTGYASLDRLRRFPVHQLKIDRSFVADLCWRADDLALVDAVVGLGRALGLGVVAEGVERRAQLDQLVELGCEVGQGYLWSRAVQAEEALALVEQHARRPRCSEDPSGRDR